MGAALTDEELARRRHPAQVALNKLPDGWADVHPFWIQILQGNGTMTEPVIVTPTNVLHRALGLTTELEWTVGRFLRYLRDWQPNIIHVKTAVQERTREPMVILGGRWTTYVFPERRLVEARLRLLKAQEDWKELAAEQTDKTVRAARKAAQDARTAQAKAERPEDFDIEVWLDLWAQRNGYSLGLEKE